MCLNSSHFPSIQAEVASEESIGVDSLALRRLFRRDLLQHVQKRHFVEEISQLACPSVTEWK